MIRAKVLGRKHSEKVFKARFVGLSCQNGGSRYSVVEKPHILFVYRGIHDLVNILKWSACNFSNKIFQSCSKKPKENALFLSSFIGLPKISNSTTKVNIFMQSCGVTRVVKQLYYTKNNKIIYCICFNLIHGCFISFPLFAVGISLPFFV